ncbi:MAG: cytochrome c [Gammaproteobacteria bacterium]|nr:cytochrome c [Gammaproteobacteria bacterium]
MSASVALSLLAVPAFAGNPDAGKARAMICVSCHGMNGISPIPNYPNLKGQNEQYLVKALRAYRDGQRNDPTMSPMARPLSDKDIDDLAAYFSSL